MFEIPAIEIYVQSGAKEENSQRFKILKILKRFLSKAPPQISKSIKKNRIRPFEKTLVVLCVSLSHLGWKIGYARLTGQISTRFDFFSTLNEFNSTKHFTIFLNWNRSHFQHHLRDFSFLILILNLLHLIILSLLRTFINYNYIYISIYNYLFLFVLWNNTYTRDKNFLPLCKNMYHFPRFTRSSTIFLYFFFLFYFLLCFFLFEKQKEQKKNTTS